MAGNPLENVRVVLVEPSAPGNVGAVARVLKNTGIGDLVLVNPGSWDTPEARWIAHGSADILDRCRVLPDLQSAVADCHIVVGATHREGRFREVDARPREALARIAPRLHTERLALVFGREKDGLWHSELLHCHHLLRFPSAVDYPSFNLSHAVLLFAYELFSAVAVAPAPASPPQIHPVSASEREQMLRHLEEVLAAIGFRPFNDDPLHFARTLRRFFNKVELDQRDVRLIHLICGQIEKFSARQKRPS